jgi:hypothetical protein
MTQHRLGGALMRALACALMIVAALGAARADQITTDARSIWRDYSSDGIPTSGLWNPRKGEIRAWGALVGSSITALEGAQTGGALAFATKATLDTSLAYAANTMAFVFADTTNNNGVYAKSGASGSGSWTKVSTLVYGPQPTFTLGSVTRTACNTDPTASVGGTALAPTLNFSLPDCDINVTVGTVASTGCGASPTITKSGNDWAPAFNFTLPDCSAAVGGLAYKGTWNAATNSPSLSAGSGAVGDYYIVATAGSTSLSGVSTWAVGDYLIRYSSGWQRVAFSALGASEYGTKAEFVSALTSMTGVTAGRVVRVRNVVAPGVGYSSCGLTYIAASSSTGIYGEVNGAGYYWQPQYSTSPVEACQFGAIGDASYSWAGNSVTATATAGNATITVDSTTSLSAGMACLSVRWHSENSTVPLASVKTISSVGSGTITLSTTPTRSGTGRIACYNRVNSTTVSGTDSYGPIQAAIDYASSLAVRAAKVHIANGKYKLSQGLMVGYGYDGYSQMIVYGDGAVYHDLLGTLFYCLDTTRPCVNVQGTRNTGVTDIALIGANLGWGYWGAFAQQYSVANSNYPSADRVDYIAQDLNASGSTPGGLQPHAPLIGFCVDCYRGSANTDRYADYTTPASQYAGAAPSGSYGRGASSHAYFHHVNAIGFGVGVGGTMNGDGNGDFIEVHDAEFFYEPVGLAVVHTQSRSLDIERIRFNGVHTVFTNTGFGVNSGRWGTTIKNASGSTTYQVFEFNAAPGLETVIFQNLYVEVLARLGKFANTSATAPDLMFLGGEITRGSNLGRLVPASLIETINTVHIVFDGFMIADDGKQMMTLASGANDAIEYRAGRIRSMNFYTGGDAAIAKAVNYTGGLVIGRSLFHANNFRLPKFGKIEVTKCSADGTDCTQRRHAGNDIVYGAAESRPPMTQFATGFRDTNGKHWTFDLPTFGYLDPNSTSYVPAGGAMSWTGCDVATFKLKGTYTFAPVAAVKTPGTIMHHSSGTNFVVTAVGAADGNGDYPITVKQMNNMVVDFNQDCLSSTHPDMAGSWFMVASPVDLWNLPFYGDFTAGSANVTNVKRGNDGYAGHLATYIAAGDKIWGPAVGNNAYSPWPANDNAVLTVSSVTAGSPGSITLTSNATYSCTQCPIFPYKLVPGGF